MFKWFKKLSFFSPVYRIELRDGRYYVWYVGKASPLHLGTRDKLEDAKFIIVEHKAKTKSEIVWEE
jgi:hypothetical protein